MNLSLKTKNKVIDPVCGMTVAPGETEILTSIGGETYYFCAEECRKSFEKNPKKFLNPKLKKKKGFWDRYLDRLEKASRGRSMKCH